MKKFIFKYRGWLFLPAAALMLILAEPTFLSMIIGFSISFFIGEGIRIWAVGFSGVTTRESALKAPELITAGPYAYVRNPLYVGNFISWIGFCIVSAGSAPLWAKITIFAFMLISYLIIYGSIIPLEEEFLEKNFGEPFKEYLKNVPGLFPRLSPYEKQNGSFKLEVIKKAEMHTIIMLVLIAVILILKYLQIISM